MTDLTKHTKVATVGKGIGRIIDFFRAVFLRLSVSHASNGLRVVGATHISGGKNIHIGKNCFIGRHVVLDGSNGPIKIGDNCEIRDFTRIYAKHITVGNNVTLGEGVLLNGNIHLKDGAWIARNCDLTGSVSIEKAILGPHVSCVGGSDHAREPVTGLVTMDGENAGDPTICILEGSWVGQGAIVLKGVVIGRNAIVGAGAVVTRNVEEGITAVGNPARKIRRKNDQYS